MQNGDSRVEELLRSRIRAVPDYPRPGIMFRDITPMLKDPVAFRACIDAMAEGLAGKRFDYVVGIEARGFIIGAALAHKMGKGFVPIRKKGKLPYKKVTADYQLEYGSETIEMHEDSVEKGSGVVIVDDLLATGGTAAAASSLVKSIGARIDGYAFVIELRELRGREKLGSHSVTALVEY